MEALALLEPLAQAGYDRSRAQDYIAEGDGPPALEGIFPGIGLSASSVKPLFDVFIGMVERTPVAPITSAIQSGIRELQRSD